MTYVAFARDFPRMGNGLAVEPIDFSEPEGRGSSPRLGSRR